LTRTPPAAKLSLLERVARKLPLSAGRLPSQAVRDEGEPPIPGAKSMTSHRPAGRVPRPEA
jgi:hypothetical protein